MLFLLLHSLSSYSELSETPEIQRQDGNTSRQLLSYYRNCKNSSISFRDYLLDPHELLCICTICTFDHPSFLASGGFLFSCSFKSNVRRRTDDRLSNHLMCDIRRRIVLIDPFVIDLDHADDCRFFHFTTPLLFYAFWVVCVPLALRS